MEDKIYKPQNNIINPYIKDFDEYKSMYEESILNPEKFFGDIANKDLLWMEPFTEVHNGDFANTRWFNGGKLNLSVNCIDRHLEKNADKIALIWEGDNPNESKKITYKELHEQVCKFSNGLKSLGAKKGDRITIYMPMIPEAAYAMLACTRIGAIHSVVFGGFSPDALAGRISDCESDIIITADEGIRGNKSIPLKANTDAAIDIAQGVRH